MKASPARTIVVPIKDLPGSLPTIPMPEDVDHVEIAKNCLKRLEDLDEDHLCTHVEAFWKDILSLTSAFRTFCGRTRIVTAWRELIEACESSCFDLLPDGSRVIIAGRTSWVQASFRFECATQPARTASGTIKIVPDELGNWKIWTICTMLEQIPEYGNVDFLSPEEEGATNGTHGHVNASSTRHYDAIIVGAGMAGLSVCGRLKALGISCIALDSYAEIGGNWTERYDSVKLHTSRASAHMPFEKTFTAEEYPYFLTGKHLTEGYQKYVRKYGLNVQTSSRVVKATWDERSRTWTVNFQSKAGLETMTARHVVLAIGGGGSVPKYPDLEGRNEFLGEVLHSVEYRTARNWKGKKGVIIGTANTAHDVAEDMLEAGLESVTMVQRNATPVLPHSYYRNALDPIYNDGLPTELSDRMFMSTTPAPIARLLILQLMTFLSSQDSEYFDALTRAGFKNERVCDLYHIVYEKLGGHYLDVGTSAKVARGLIKVKSDAPLARFNEGGLGFSDGSTLDADVVVFATGFEGNMRVMATQLLNKDVVDLMDDFYRFDAEGEVIGLWKPMKQPNIWYAGGGIDSSRFFSRFLALQIKADLEGAAFEPYLKHKA